MGPDQMVYEITMIQEISEDHSYQDRSDTLYTFFLGKDACCIRPLIREQGKVLFIMNLIKIRRSFSETYFHEGYNPEHG
jgi:hypothetical protein